MTKIVSMFQLDGCYQCCACSVAIIKWYGFVVQSPPIGGTVIYERPPPPPVGGTGLTPDGALQGGGVQHKSYVFAFCVNS